MNAQEFFRASKIVKQAYDTDKDYRGAVIASILSAIKELKGSHSDEQVAVAIAERLFGDE